jgi:hypothetical protein
MPPLIGVTRVPPLVESSWTPFVVALRVLLVVVSAVGAFEGGYEFKPAQEALACFVSVFAVP